MGVTLHYRGRINDVDRVDAVTDELADIARTMNWPSTRFDDDWSRPAFVSQVVGKSGLEISGNLGLKGVAITMHADCGIVPFLFDSRGDLRDVMGAIGILDGSVDPNEAFVSVKTQFAPIEIHVALVKLFRYLKKQHIANLEVTDEGGYWGTENEAILREKRDFLAGKMDEIASALRSAEIDKSERQSPTDLADAIERILRENLRGKRED